MLPDCFLFSFFVVFEKNLFLIFLTFFPFIFHSNCSQETVTLKYENTKRVVESTPQIKIYEGITPEQKLLSTLLKIFLIDYYGFEVFLYSSNNTNWYEDRNVAK